MRKRAIILLVAIAVVAAAIVAFVLIRRKSPPTTVNLLPPADAYLFFDVATVRRAALGELPKIDLDPEYANFVKETGFNLEKDLDQAAFALQHAAATPGSEAPEWRDTGVFVATFDRAKVEAYFKKIASGTETYRDTTVFLVPLPGRTVRVAILDKRTVAASNTDGPYVIDGIIDRHAQYSPATPDLVRAHYDSIPWGTLAWAVAKPPVSTPGGNVRLELPGGLGVFLPSETVVVASLRFLGSVELKAQAFATSNDAAQRIADQLSAFLALFRALQTQAQGNDADVRAFFDSIHINLQENRAELQAEVPVGFVKKLVAQAPTGIEKPEQPPTTQPSATQTPKKRARVRHRR